MSCTRPIIVLGEYIDHHVKEEQNEIFPKELWDTAIVGGRPAGTR